MHLYVEGDLHPADMAWCACLTQEEYKEVYEKYPEYKAAFEENKSEWHEYIILAYTKVAGLSPEPKAAIERAAKERIDEQGHRVWKERVAQYITASPYGMKKGVTGMEGMYQYFEQRKEMEIRMLEKLSVKKYIVPVEVQHQDASTQQIIQYIMDEIV